MAKGNGRLTAKTVGEWFSVMAFSEQADVLGKLQEIHSKVRQVKIDSLKRELSLLEEDSTNGHATSKRAKRGPKKGGLKVKYRDPKSGETWSGRGRMARWLADKVKAGDKQEKYLA
jgi:DNA-binding protein H-NS